MDKPDKHWYVRGYLTFCRQANLRTYVPHNEVNCPTCLIGMHYEGIKLTEEQEKIVNACLTKPRG